MTTALVAFALFAVLSADASPQFIVLRSGERIAVSGELRREGDRVIFRSRSGALYSLPASDIDEEPTARAASPQPASAAGAEPQKPATRKLRGDEATKRKLLADLAKSRGTPVQPAPPTATPQAIPAAAAAADAEKKSEESWRRRSLTIEANLKIAQDRVRYLEARIRDLDDEVRALLVLGNAPDTISRQVVELQDTKARLERAETDLKSAEAERAAFQDEARRAGVLPGWLR